jgi:hypothetical protein
MDYFELLRSTDLQTGRFEAFAREALVTTIRCSVDRIASYLDEYLPVRRSTCGPDEDPNEASKKLASKLGQRLHQQWQLQI